MNTTLMSETCNKRHFRNRSSEKKILNTLNGKAWTQGKRFPRTWLWLIEYSLAIFFSWTLVRSRTSRRWRNMTNTATGSRSSWSWTNRVGPENVRIDTSILNGKAEPAPNSYGSFRNFVFRYEINRGSGLEQGTVGRTERVFLRIKWRKVSTGHNFLLWGKRARKAWANWLRLPRFLGEVREKTTPSDSCRFLYIPSIWVPWLWWAGVQYTLNEFGDMRMLADKEIVDPGMCRWNSWTQDIYGPVHQTIWKSIC